MQAGNYAEAYCAWRSLAEKNDAEAQYNLGWMYHNGYGLQIDDRKARDWWEQAAAQDFPDALAALGNLYYGGGREVPVDGTRAVDYFLRAAHKDDDESAALLRSLMAKNDAAVAPRRAELLMQHAQALGGAIVVRADNSGFRKSAATESKMLAVFPAGKALVELSRRSGWVQAGDPADGRVGWIKATRVGAAEK
jgi:TPR repeat protein